MSKLRSARIDGELKRVLSEVLTRDVKDPRMSKMVGVTGVQSTGDLRYAKVYVSIYDDPEKVESTMEALASAEPFIRARVNEKMRLRRIPNLSFVLDTSMEYAAHISKLLDEVAKKDQKDSD
mgnify:CR=1 FL=1